jgi:hypothetical protein
VNVVYGKQITGSVDTILRNGATTHMPPSFAPCAVILHRECARPSYTWPAGPLASPAIEQ